jgi:hypothetical protein
MDLTPDFGGQLSTAKSGKGPMLIVVKMNKPTKIMF